MYVIADERTLSHCFENDKLGIVSNLRLALLRTSPLCAQTNTHASSLAATTGGKKGAWLFFGMPIGCS